MEANTHRKMHPGAGTRHL